MGSSKCLKYHMKEMTELSCETTFGLLHSFVMTQ